MEILNDLEKSNFTIEFLDETKSFAAKNDTQETSFKKALSSKNSITLVQTDFDNLSNSLKSSNLTLANRRK